VFLEEMLGGSGNRTVGLNFGDREFAMVSDQGFARPRGDITTVLDLTDRDDQDDTLFPLDTEVTRFMPVNTKVAPFTQTDVEFVHRGPAEFGQTFVFDMGRVGCGDFLAGLALQVRLGHWFPEAVLQGLSAGQTTYSDPMLSTWFYANSLGTILIQKAELEIDGTVIETIDGDFINLWSLLSADLNKTYGISSDGLGRVPVSLLRRWAADYYYLSFPTDNRTIICPLLFHFGRGSTGAGSDELLPLVAIRDGTCRVRITLRPFSEVVRAGGGMRASCDDTPLGRDFGMMIDPTGGTSPSEGIIVRTGPAAPLFENVQLMTRSVFLGGPLRDAFMKKPFEYLYRQVQTFVFDEPLKYAVSKSATLTDSVEIQLPLELNHPVEELIWFVRRKGVVVNNEWTNYTMLLEQQRAAIGGDPGALIPAPVVSGKIQINGIDLIEAEGDYFRRTVAENHPGGIIPWLACVYGYSFARKPGKHQPSGWMNASRAWTVRLSLTVATPPALTGLPAGFDATVANTWEVRVYAMAMNWLRFENGIANRMFTS
jgi:hypothetical protein